MDILTLSTDWAKTEIYATKFFILFGVIFLIAGIGFWQLGKTEMAKAFIYPNLVSGILLLIIGIGLFFNNKSRLSNFEKAGKNEPSALIQLEIERADKTIVEFKNVFKILSIITIIASAIVIFIDKPLWRAIGISTIALMSIVLFIDSNSNARMEEYNEQLIQLDKKQ